MNPDAPATIGDVIAIAFITVWVVGVTVCIIVAVHVLLTRNTIEANKK